MRKLPEPFNNKVMVLFNEAIERQETCKENFKVNLQIDHSLGLAITRTRNLLAEKCKEGYLVRSSKISVAKNPRICCKQYLDKIPGQYGCTLERKQTRRKPRRKNYRFKKYKQPYKKKFFRKNKYFKRYNKAPRKGKKRTKEDKKKFCPQKKKNCRCWLCNETRHYANECPSKIGHEDRVKMLETFEKQGFYPVEDPSDTESLYYLTTDSESESDYSSTSTEDG
ncbi:Uncharacterized protein Adt_18537 [Abeliophyllum distichum]|uniref:CCHC-type domain-containing protein n=1 Tax=Abeliophyllum distichum TaxID=126358 RepID=A0ABD1TJM8_9LAMI